VNHGWTDLFLGVIAAATLAIAIVHIVVLIGAGMVARRVGQLIDQVEGELKPVFGHLQAIARDASRAASVAGAQVERTDRLFADVAQRIEQTVAIVQASVVQPIREGRALVNAFRAGLGVIRDMRSRSRRGAEDEDALFI
jgi:uncharacterized protein YoxC